MTTWTTQLRKGVTELALLAALKEGEAYGYQLVEKLAKVQGLDFSESTVYPLLARLAKEDLLTVRTMPSAVGPPRRYYRLTSQGRGRLEEMVRHWRHIVVGLAELLGNGDHS